MIYCDVNRQSFAVSAWGRDNRPKTLTYAKLRVETLSLAKLQTQVDVRIDDAFAAAIYDAWCAMLLKTRYPERLLSGTDGWEAEFSAWVPGAGAVYGRSTPVGGFAKELMDFGFALKDYCLAGEEDRKNKRVALIPLLKDFTTRVKQSRLY